MGVLLFGETLRDAAIAVLRASARNVKAAASAEGQRAVKQLAERLSAFALAREGEVAADQWLLLYRRFVSQVLVSGEIPVWTDAQLNDLLAAMEPGNGA
jgi:hypothetical protein